MSTSSAAATERQEHGSARCPVCDSAAMSRTGTLHGFPLLHCRGCGHDCLWAEGSDLSDLYDSHYAGFREDPVFNRRVREVFASSIAPHLKAGARVLDVGCGNGEFLLAAAERGHEVFGMDTAPAAAEMCQKRGLSAVAADFLTWQFFGLDDGAAGRASAPSAPDPGARAPFDLVTMWDVCEHLTRPFDFMRRAREILAPGGLLVLKVPCPSPRAVRIAARVPRVSGALLSSPAHIQYFHPDGFPVLLRRAGFERVDVEPLGPMRGVRPRSGLISRARRKIAQGLIAFAGSSNVLVRARVSAAMS